MDISGEKPTRYYARRHEHGYRREILIDKLNLF